MHDEGELAELTGRGLGRCEPLLQTRLVHILEASRAVAGRQEGVLSLALAVTDAANVPTVLGRLTAAGPESEEDTGKHISTRVFPDTKTCSLS